MSVAISLLSLTRSLALSLRFLDQKCKLLRSAPFVFVCSCLCLNACYFPEVSLSESEARLVEQSILRDADEAKPSIIINAIMEDQARLIGIDIDRKSARPNEVVKVTYYIESLTDTPEDCEIFVHLQGKRARMWQNLDHTPVKGLLPLRTLKRGQVVRDVQTFRVKSTYAPGGAKLYWGLFTKSGRVKIKNRGEVTHDGKERVELTSLTILPRRPPVTVTAYEVFSSEILKIDGQLTENSWRTAKWTPFWLDPLGRYRRHKNKNTLIPQTRAKFLWRSDALFIAIEAIDHHVWAKLTERDSNTWEEEVVEVFLDLDGDKRQYLELQVTPANVVFDAKFAYHRSDLKTARAWNMKGWRTAVYIDGTLNDSSDRDRKYTVEMMIPLSETPGAPSVLSAESSPWRLNLFRFDWNQAPQGRQKAAALSPPYIGDFHALDAFAKLRFKAQPKKPVVKQRDRLQTVSSPTPKSSVPVAKPVAP